LAELLEALPEGILSWQRLVCVQEFERGRAHLMFAFSIKIGPFTEPPSLIFAIAHQNQSTSMRALLTCLASASAHPKIRQLQTEPLLTEATLCLEGMDFRELRHLEVFLSEVFGGFAAERLVEAGHATVNLRSHESASIRSV
jgi:hypothetical protein